MMEFLLILLLLWLAYIGLYAFFLRQDAKYWEKLTKNNPTLR